MRCKSAVIWVIFFLLFSGLLSAQSIDAIKKEKEKSEKEISYLNKLLNDTKNSKSVSAGRLHLLQEKIVQSKRLLSSLNQEVRYLENQVQKNEKRITELVESKESMLDLYAKLIYGLWKKRDKTHKLMFIFSSSDFNQAYNRYKYFEQIQSYSARQLFLINQLNDSLYVKNEDLKNWVKKKNAVVEEVENKTKDLSLQQKNENSLIQEFQKKEKDILRQLQKEKKNRQRLARELDKLIAAQTRKSGSSSSVYKITPEEKLISEDFEKNKGKLPWPVTQGIVSEKFGINPHPVYKRVMLENNGISITTLKNAEVRAIFDGVVSYMIFLPGFNNTVIVRHGNYLTVYSNLVGVTVKSGDKVKVKQVIGKVAYDNDKGSVLNFQLWKNMDKQNPEYWLAK